MPSSREQRLRDAEKLFCEAAELAGPRLTELARSGQLTTITEIPHLQKKFKEALEERALKAPPAAKRVAESLARPQARVAAPRALRHFPEVGQPKTCSASSSVDKPN